MIKATSTNGNDGVILILGLTDKNEQLMREGAPVVVNLSSVGLRLVRTGKQGVSDPSEVDPDGNVMIVRGQDEAFLARSFGYMLDNPKPGHEIQIRRTEGGEA